MKATLRKMGNSQGVLIPKTIVSQLGIEDELRMTIENDAIVLRKPQKSVRAGWAEASRRVTEVGDDAPVWPKSTDTIDQELVR